jgi:predicted pyridoxine 5'-phosphate oxidase superfamily flavin-nucleotide-binding protein/predicted NBD/HSP70 family sugar kinase
MAQDKNGQLSARAADERHEPSLGAPGGDKAADTPAPDDAGAAGSSAPPPLPPRLPASQDNSEPDLDAVAPPPIGEHAPEDEAEDEVDGSHRRVARRRPAGTSRNRIAANDDGPSIGGLIFALQEKPSNAAFKYAGIASVVWAVIGCGFGLFALGADAPVQGWYDLLTRPTTFFTFTAIIVPIAVLWLLALLSWRAEELRLRSSTMTEVAIRLAEPDRLAEQSIASLGQAVRRQVSFMNDAISRALGRAGELEALVHNEVSLLERSYEENERKVRGLIQELSGERHALVNTSDHVCESLQRLGGEIPALIDKLSDQQVKLAGVIEGASDNLTSLETSLASSVGNLETAVGGRTDQLQNMLENYTGALATALGSRADKLQTTLDDQLQQLDTSFGDRTENLQAVFEEYARALDSALANRAKALDDQLIERTRSLDDAFAERLRMFDDSIMRSTSAIDTAVVEKTEALTHALDEHAIRFSGTIGKQATDLDESLMHGINSVRRASENVTRQSLKAMEGLANQSEMLKSISQNLLGQIAGITGRFENQGEAILSAANQLESANYKIDETLQTRHADLTQTLERLSGKADEFANFVQGYSSSIEGSISEADDRARHELDRLRMEAASQSERTLEDLRQRLSTVSNTMTSELGSLTDRFSTTSEDMRREAARAASEIAAEQNRLREQLERLPVAAQESSESMRRALQDQIKALDQLSALTSRAAVQRDVITPPEHSAPPPPYAPPPPPQQRHPAAPDTARSLTSISSTIAAELGNRQRQPRPPPPQPPLGPAPGRPSDAREGWSLGDLLARASLDDDGASHAGSTQPAPPAFNLDLEAIAHALDPATAGAVWQRLRGGQRGVMVRSIYSGRGQALYDEVSQRARSDIDLSRAISRYLADFERAVMESDQRDPTGQLTQGQLVSDAGRVYLFLAHASGRLN